MSMRSILVPWWGGSTAISQLDAALSLARHVEAHLEVVFVKPQLSDLATMISSVADVPSALLQQLEHSVQEDSRSARATFEAWREREDVPGQMIDMQIRVPFAKWSERDGLPEQLILRKGRVTDLTVLRFTPVSGALDAPVDAAIFETGRPVLLVPDHVNRALLSHVVVAWNGSLHSTRAVIGAMALLRAAERVTVLTTTDLDVDVGGRVGGTDQDLVDALSWHGVEARHQLFEPGTSVMGRAVLREAKDLNATLLVMGAFTHSRVAAASLGGVTKHLFMNPPGIPVLLAH